MRKLFGSYGISLACLVSMLIGLGITSAEAAPVNSLPEGTVIPFPLFDWGGTNTIQFAPGITWSTNTTSSFGGALGYSYGFGSNGKWWSEKDPITQAPVAPFTDVGTGAGTITFEFDTPVAGVGGFLNYAPNLGTPQIAVYDTDNNIIEGTTLSHQFTADTWDQGVFYGFRETTPNIRYFTLSNAYMGLRDLTTVAVPEPATLSLLALGGLAMLRRRHRS